MNHKLLRFVFALLFAAIVPAAFAQTAKVTMTTDAPAGTELRIYSMPYNSVTVTGADPSMYFGTYLSKGPGTQITLEGDIEELEVYRCQLTSLTVESAPDMYILRCYENAISSLDLSNAAGLIVLDCHNNNLGSLDVSKNTLLETLNVADNEISQIIFGNQPKVTSLNISGNKLSSVDLSSFTALEDLYAQHNELTTLDLSANAKAKLIYAFCNRITGENMTKFMSSLPKATQALSMVYVVDTFADEANEGNKCLMMDVDIAYEQGWITMDYANGNVNNGLIGQFYYGADYVPVISDNGVKFTTSRQPGETIKIYVKSADEFTIEGVQEKNFVSGSNTLTLSSTEVFVKGDLTVFECPANDITTLTIEGTPSRLTSFDCSNNKIESLIITGAPALTQIHAQKNALKTLNIEGCTGIMRVDCYDNQLSGIAMKRFMQSLPDGSANNPYLFVIDTKSSTEQNVATTNDVAIATGKGWSVFDFIGGDRYGMGVKYEGSEPTGPEVPEEYFTFSAAESTEIMLNTVFSDPEYYPVVENAELIGWGSNALTLRVVAGETVTVFGDLVTLSANFANLSTLDTSACPNLTDLNLSVNELNSLNISKNAKLKNLLAFGNNLESLDVSGCTDLEFIICYGNKLAGDAMTQFMSTLPMRSSSKAGQIVIYDGSYEREHNVCLPADVEAAYNRCWLTYELVDGTPIRYNGVSGVEDVTAEDANAHVEYFNLQGIRVENPENGIYIRRQGRTVSKVLVR